MDSMKSRTTKGSARAGLVLLLSLALVGLCACGLPSPRPSLSIRTPQKGVPAGDVTVTVDIAGFTLMDRTDGPNVIGKGHVLYYLDVPVPTYYSHSAYSKAGTFAVGFGDSYTWTDVPPGTHTFSAQLVNFDGSPLPAPVVATVTLEVDAPQGSPGISFRIPEAGASLSPGNVFVEMQVDHFILDARSFGVANRSGEGHLIYYLDEDPPTDPGIPALTDACKVSADLRQLWKDVLAGNHTLSVQLVNNDDTPLVPPVVASMSITVAAGG